MPEAGCSRGSVRRASPAHRDHPLTVREDWQEREWKTALGEHCGLLGAVGDLASLDAEIVEDVAAVLTKVAVVGGDVDEWLTAGRAADAGA